MSDMTHEASIGVGDGRGNLFVHGAYEAIKRVQDIILENERLRRENEALRQGRKPAVAAPAHSVATSVTDEPCGCRRCRIERDERHPDMPALPITAAMMIVCSVCGNKRCPHAADHRHACTGSNEPGQPGSAY